MQGTRRPRLFPIRWSIFACLFGFSFFGYMQRTGVTIVAEPMMRELGLDPGALGWLLTAFLVGYTLFQIPGAILGEYWGARRALTWMGAATLVATAVTALAPRLAGVGAVLAILIGARLLLGLAQAGLYPVATGALKSWFPVRNWGFAQGLLVTGIWIGSAVTPPLMSAVMTHFGWRAAIAAATLPSLALLVWWHLKACDRPAEHPAVSAGELAELTGGDGADERVTLSRLARVLVDRQVLLLSISYLLMNYLFYLVTFWSFEYLRQERSLTVLESGWLASLPFVTAAVAAAVGGRVSDDMVARWGPRLGMRVLPIVSLSLAGVFLWLTGVAGSAYLAVAALCLAFGCCELVEGPYWSAVMRAAPSDAMAASAVLNTGGNIGGVVATPAIAALSVGHHWDAIFALGAAASLGAALLWFWVDVAHRGAQSQEVRA